MMTGGQRSGSRFVPTERCQELLPLTPTTANDFESPKYRGTERSCGFVCSRPPPTGPSTTNGASGSGRRFARPLNGKMVQRGRMRYGCDNHSVDGIGRCQFDAPECQSVRQESWSGGSQVEPKLRARASTPANVDACRRSGARSTGPLSPPAGKAGMAHRRSGRCASHLGDHPPLAQPARGAELPGSSWGRCNRRPPNAFFFGGKGTTLSTPPVRGRIPSARTPPAEPQRRQVR